MYHLLVDHSKETNARTMARSSENEEDIKIWFDRIVKFDPDSATFWDGPILLKYYVREEK